VRLNWSRPAGSLGYEIQGNKVGVPGAQTLPVGNPSVTSRDVFGLQPGTAYWWRSRSWCSQNPTLRSPWSARDTFETSGRAKLALTAHAARHFRESDA